MVDDNEDIRTLVAEQVAALGYEVTQADSGDAALVVLEQSESGPRTNDFDLLLSDVMMPGDLNGVDLAKVVRRRWPDVAVLLISGFSGTAEMEAETRDFPLLSKPFRKLQLAQSVRQVLDESLTAQPND